MNPSAHSLHIEVTQDGGATIVHPVGELTVLSFGHLRDTLVKCAVDEPDVVVLLADDLIVHQEVLYSVFVQAWMQVSDWPGVPIVIAALDRRLHRRLSALPMARFVPVHGSLRRAISAAGHPPERRRMQRTLPHHPASSHRARQLVAETCARWDLRWTTYDAAAVATELVENTLLHTTSDPVLRLELRRGTLTVAVSDDDPAPALIKEREPGGKLRLGMLVVAQAARVWGCTPTLSGGKVTWAVLPPDVPRYGLPGER